MLQKRFITLFLAFVFVLQLLPIRQAVQYFWVDNITVEEIVHVTKSPVKPPTVIDEDHLMNDSWAWDHPGADVLSSPATADPLVFTDNDPAEVETPPPNPPAVSPV